jgi:hypothetical protein
LTADDRRHILPPMEPSHPNLPRTSQAVHRLQQAVARLEGALARSGNGDLLLAEELRLARADYERLKGVTQSVSLRLDKAIGRLQDVLGE